MISEIITGLLLFVIAAWLAAAFWPETKYERTEYEQWRDGW